MNIFGAPEEDFEKWLEENIDDVDKEELLKCLIKNGLEVKE